MDSVNRMLLDQIQRSFPLAPRPFQRLAVKLQVDEQEVMERIRALKERKLLRQISAIFNTGALGYRSSLVAMAVEEGKLEEAARVVNSYPGVSHNYLRPGRFNMWFTIAVPPADSLENVVNRLAEEAGGCETLILPAGKKYKLAVVLDVLEEGETEPAEGAGALPALDARDFSMPDSRDIRVVRCIQEDLPLVEKPFETWAGSLGMEEDELLGLISLWLQKGVMRRFAAVLNHRQVGFKANGMIVWRCPEESLDRMGAILASHPEVSHCYYRPAYPQWPFNLYAMVHGRSEEDCMRIASKLGDAIGSRDYQILFSTREFKKIRLKLFWDEPPVG